MTNSSVKCSVIIPCYNQGRFIKEAVDSVLLQTFQDFEIIVVNDGSTDPETNQILSAFSAPKTTILHTSNQGPAAARNTAIQAAKGLYILPLDADDKIAPTYLEKAIDVLEKNNDIGIVYCDAEFFGNETGKWDLSPYSLKRILNSNCIFVSSFFHKSAWEKVGGFKENMIFSLEDWDFWLSLIENGSNVYKIPETLFFYRKQETSRTSLAKKFDTVSCRQLILNHLDFYAQNVLLLKGTVRQIFFSKKIKKHLKKRNLSYFLALAKYRTDQCFEIIKSYLMFPIYIQRIYRMMKEDRK